MGDVTGIAINDLRLAVHCAHLKRSAGPRRGEERSAVCLHVIREGRECVGPFLDDLGTTCGLWEADECAAAIPVPQHHRAQRRKRPEGWEFRTAYGD
jgi:hypothetical protein